MNFDFVKQVVEALIFSSDIPLPMNQIQNIIEKTSVGEIKKAIEELNLEYKQTNRTFSIVQIGGGFQLVTRESYNQWIRKLLHKRIKSKLSQAALETLSVIAFNQPVSKSDIEAVRGVNCDGVIRTLLERKLVTIKGRSDGPGRPLLFITTKEFLRYFGVNNISDLPKPREIEEILKEDEEVAEELIETDHVGSDKKEQEQSEAV
jgi:segregation and condensation protein B